MQNNHLSIIYEDNHLIGVNKLSGQLVQGDKTNDLTLPDYIKEYLKEKFKKPGNVFCGVIHRLDRPTSGVVLFARTSKALSRLNLQFQNKEPEKTYWAIVEKNNSPEKQKLVHYLKKNEKKNKSFCVDKNTKGAKKAILNYSVIKHLNKYSLVEITLETGRHHQIRCQLSKEGMFIKGDVKYGAKRPNANGSICLHARKISFKHPTKEEKIYLEAAVPKEDIWKKI